MVPIISYLLINLDIDKVSNMHDFMTGFFMAVLVIIMLWLAYSLVRSIRER